MNVAQWIVLWFMLSFVLLGFYGWRQAARRRWRHVNQLILRLDVLAGQNLFGYLTDEEQKEFITIMNELRRISDERQ